MKKLIIIYSLFKMKITYTVVFTSFIGYYFASLIYPHPSITLLILNLLSTGIVCAGVCALNHVLEGKSDGMMKRTQNRPIPTGKISKLEGWLWGSGFISLGLLIMFNYFEIGLFIGSLFTCFLYLFIYTPLKKITWLNTSIGAIPGALPVIGGWYALSGKIELESILLFFIIFFWQHPHFYAIAWLCREDYKKAGYKMITENDPQGKKTFSHSLIHAGLLFLISLTIPFLDRFKPILTNLYLIGIIILGIWFFYETVIAFQKKSILASKRLLTSSIFYLPLFFLALLINNLFN